MNAAATETRSLLAGAYKGGRTNLKATLTHSVGVDADGREADFTLCGKISSDKLSDHFGMTAAERAAAPTCKDCLARLARR